MRFIGSKSELLPFIEKNIRKYCKESGQTFGDLFCGTAVVSGHFKKLGYSVTANDNLFFASIMAKAILLNNEEPPFTKLIDNKEINTKNIERLSPTLYDATQCYLNKLDGIDGFIYSHYSPSGTKRNKLKRKYFTDENAKKIDAIREKIFEWQLNKLLSEGEEAILLTDLMKASNRVANIAGTYGMFMKDWMDNRVFKPLLLTRSEIIKSKKKHYVYNLDANKLIKKIHCDILYLDPPYTWRHYGSYYHMLETIALWDKPKINGLSGLRPWKDTKSKYSYRHEALGALLELIEKATSKYIFLSYNNEGLISHESLCEKLPEFGELKIEETQYKRYKSNNHNNNHTDGVVERLYFVKKE
jgi:adenine-specific DNA-methyltransferase